MIQLYLQVKSRCLTSRCFLQCCSLYYTVMEIQMWALEAAVMQELRKLLLAVGLIICCSEMGRCGGWGRVGGWGVRGIKLEEEACLRLGEAVYAVGKGANYGKKNIAPPLNRRASSIPASRRAALRRYLLRFLGVRAADNVVQRDMDICTWTRWLCSRITHGSANTWASKMLRENQHTFLSFLMAGWSKCRWMQ